MSQEIQHGAVAAWQSIAFNTKGASHAERLEVHTDGDGAHHEALVISREPASNWISGAEEQIDLLIISLSKRNSATGERVKPSDSSLIKHIVNLLGETYAAASVAQAAMSPDGYSAYRLCFVGEDQMPIMAMHSKVDQDL